MLRRWGKLAIGVTVTPSKWLLPPPCLGETISHGIGGEREGERGRGGSARGHWCWESWWLICCVLLVLTAESDHCFHLSSGLCSVNTNIPCFPLLPSPLSAPSPPSLLFIHCNSAVWTFYKQLSRTFDHLLHVSEAAKYLTILSFNSKKAKVSIFCVSQKRCSIWAAPPVLSHMLDFNYLEAFPANFSSREMK